MADARVLEIRTYRVRDGGGEEFETRFHDGALPMLRRHGIDVVAFGPSLEGPEHYVLLRAFGSLDERDAQESAFYDSDEWRTEHRPGIMALIETYHTVVLETTADAVAGLAASSPSIRVR